MDQKKIAMLHLYIIIQSKERGNLPLRPVLSVPDKLFVLPPGLQQLLPSSAQSLAVHVAKRSIVSSVHCSED